MKEGRTVFLDASPIRDRFRERFPGIYGECVRHGITPGVDLIPVTPAAHFIMGGIRTDHSGRTTLPGLFACGEVACTGVHGANRLASNSLLEGAVFARRVAECLNAMPVRSTDIGDVDWTVLCNDKHDEEAIKDEIRDIMWEYAGIVRSGESLRLGKEKLALLRSRIREGMLECENMLTVAQMIVNSALWREESRGGHYRGDFPQSIPAWGMRHHVIQRGTVHESH
jgi:L-aspartate oxidase